MAVVTIAHVEAGTTDNVIPERAFMEGTVRALSDGTREAVLENARRVVEHVAAAHGMEATLTVDEGYPPTINDAAMAAFALDVVRETVGDDRVEEMRDPVMGAEDFSTSCSGSRARCSGWARLRRAWRTRRRTIRTA